MPRVIITGRPAIALGLFVVSVVAFLYFVVPKLTGLGRTWDRLDQGAPGWLAVAAAFEALSFAGYVALFRTVFVRAGRSQIDWRASYEITMAGLAATRLFAAAGSGGVALTVWALRRAGLERAGGGRTDGDLHHGALRRLHGGAGRLRARPAHGRAAGRRRLRDHDPAGDLRRPGDRAVPRADADPRRRRAAPRFVGGPSWAPPARGAADRAADHAAGAGGERRARRAGRSCARAIRGCSARSPGGRFDIATLWASFKRVRGRARDQRSS